MLLGRGPDRPGHVDSGQAQSSGKKAFVQQPLARLELLDHVGNPEERDLHGWVPLGTDTMRTAPSSPLLRLNDDGHDYDTGHDHGHNQHTKGHRS